MGYYPQESLYFRPFLVPWGPHCTLGAPTRPCPFKPGTLIKHGSNQMPWVFLATGCEAQSAARSESQVAERPERKGRYKIHQGIKGTKDEDTLGVAPSQ